MASTYTMIVSKKQSIMHSRFDRNRYVIFCEKICESASKMQYHHFFKTASFTKYVLQWDQKIFKLPPAFSQHCFRFSIYYLVKPWMHINQNATSKSSYIHCVYSFIKCPICFTKKSFGLRNPNPYIQNPFGFWKVYTL